MALLKKILSKNIWWVYNNRPYVEPTDEQKIIEAKRKEMVSSGCDEFMSGLSRLYSLCPQAFERTFDCINTAKIFM